MLIALPNELVIAQDDPDIIWRLAKQSSAAAQIAVMRPGRELGPVVADSAHVHFVEATPSAGEIVRVKLDGTQRSPVAGDASGVEALAADSTCVYWINGSGELKRAPR